MPSSSFTWNDKPRAQSLTLSRTQNLPDFINYVVQRSIQIYRTLLIIPTTRPPHSTNMAAGKDMRRGDLSMCLFIANSCSTSDKYVILHTSTDSSPQVIPYQVPAVKESPSDFSGTLGSTLPMAAMFTRNKLIGWCVDSVDKIGIHPYIC